MKRVPKNMFQLGLLLNCAVLAGNVHSAELDNVAARNEIAPHDDVVARMGEVELHAAEVRALIEARQKIETDPAALERLVRKELVRRAVLLEARKKAWDQRPEIVQKMEAAREQVMLSTWVNSLARPPAGYPSEEEIKAAYKDGKDTFKVSSQGRAAQIYVAPSEVSGKKVVESDQAKAPDTITRAPVKKDESTAAPAKSSNESSPKAAQRTEPVQQHEVAAIPEKRATQPDIKNGDISTAIRSGQGWHIEMKAATPRELADVRENIVQTLRWRKAQENETKYLQDVASRAPIEIEQARMAQVLQTLSAPER